jgi:hypothetical protein
MSALSWVEVDPELVAEGKRGQYRIECTLGRLADSWSLMVSSTISGESQFLVLGEFRDAESAKRYAEGWDDQAA